MARDIWGNEYEDDGAAVTGGSGPARAGAGRDAASRGQGCTLEAEAEAVPEGPELPSREELEREVHGLDTGDPLTAQVVGALERSPATFEENPALVHAVLILASRVEVMDRHINGRQAPDEGGGTAGRRAGRAGMVAWPLVVGVLAAGAALVAVALASGGAIRF